MKTIYVVTGWSESNWQRRQFSKGFRGKYVLTQNADEADILVAHSSGCLSLPRTHRATKIILIDPPHYPERSPLRCILQNTFLDAPKQIREWGLWFWLRLRLHNIIFGITHPLHHVKIWRSLNKTLLLATDHATQTLVIRDSRDAFCSPSIAKVIELTPGVKFIELLGLHETCWAHPEPYLSQIQAL